MNNAPELRPLGEALGTEVRGVDLSQPIDEPTFAWIARAFAEHAVLVFRDQHLGAAELAVFGRRFGAPRQHALVAYRYEGVPEVSWLRNVDDAGAIDWYGVKRATDWHTDSTYEPELPLLAILHALEVPAAKGGTMFADMRAAYDALPEAMKQRLSGLVGLHGRTDGPVGARLYSPDEAKNMTDTDYPEQQRPADPVRQPDAHPRVSRHGAWGGVAPDRGARGTRHPGALCLLPFVAGRRRADVGRAVDDAPGCGRLPAGRAPRDAAHDRLSELIWPN